MAEELVADQKNSAGEWIKSFSIDKVLYRTLSGRRWKNMQTRCFNPKRYETYRDAECEFRDFPAFVDWSVTQIGYKNLDWHLDADALRDGVKIYSPSTCVFIPQALNKFFRDYRDKGLPVGVKPNGKKFQALCNDSSEKKVYIGTYPSPEEAFQAYKTFKEATARELASKYQHLVDPRVYEKLWNYEAQ
jgi:hypothetical protein